MSKLGLIMAVCVNSIAGVIIRDYNMVNFQEFKTFHEFAEVHMNLQENTVTQNLFVGVATPECMNLLESPAFRGGAQRHGGGNVLASLTIPASEFKLPLKENECAQIFFYRIGDSIIKPQDVTNEFEHAKLNRWCADFMRISGFRYTNKFDFPVEVFWHEESMEPVSNGVLEVGQSTEIATFLGHIFSAHEVLLCSQLN